MTSTHTERINAIRFDVTLPGTEIGAELRDRDQVTLSFGRGRYDYLRERDLEQYLASLARLLYVGWVRAYRESVDPALASYDVEESWARKEFVAARDGLTSRGASADGRVSITAHAMREVTVRVADGTVRQLDEHEFASTTREAVAALIANHLEQVAELKQRFFW